MQLILLSGGSGERLWPLSDASHPKQFLKLLTDSDGQPLSMLQRIWQQLETTSLSTSTIISTSKGQAAQLHEQIGSNVPLILEPSSRNTYPAILLSTLYLYCIKHVTPQEIIVVMPVDAYVTLDFFQHIKELEKALTVSHANVALIGIKPTSPSSKYGYIVPQPSSNSSLNSSYQKVLSFIEKPSTAKANDLIKEGALWNGGIFAFKLEFILNYMKAHHIPCQYDELLSQYDTLPQISFDYQILENIEDLIVTTYNGKWKDLGTFNTLTQEIPESIKGQGIVSHDCENIHIINQLDLPIGILGLKDIVVVATPSGILISSKASSPRVKEITSQLQTMSPPNAYS